MAKKEEPMVDTSPFADAKPSFDLPGADSLVIKQLQDWFMAGPPKTGKYIMGAPIEMKTILDFTGLRGSASNVFWTFTHRVGKMRYTIRKIDEWMEVNPNYTELYNSMVGQKQRIEGSIKSSLGSVAQAVADYELLKHDSRRYKEILDYFKKGQTDQHVIRSLFVDRVDSFTGEGYSLITMAKRWPTIITDFIRMKEQLETVDAIRKELDVTQAEATVLKTKNELFKEWKILFLPTVKERYARIEALVRARRRSIEEYKTWLKPYVTKYKAMREGTEHGQWSYATNAFSTPGFGTMDAWSCVRFLVFRPFQPVEGGKPEAFIEKKGEGFIIDPYDDHAKLWKEKIEEKYGVKIPDSEVRELLKKAIVQQPDAHCALMDPQAIYYIVFDINILLSTLKSPPPEGVEMDNIMFIPIKIWMMSHNNLLIHLLEIKAREKWMEKYMDELIGARSIEQEVYEQVEKEFKGEKEEKKEKGGRWEFLGGLKPKYYIKYPDDKKLTHREKVMKSELVPNLMMKFVNFFIKPGPYEPIFKERVSKMYMRASAVYYKRMIDLVEQAMGIE